MRAVPIAVALLTLSAVGAHAEDMVGSNPSGIMCKDEKALAAIAGPDGAEKPSVMKDPYSPVNKPLTLSCTAVSGATVHVVSKRKNTSIVTYNGQTYYVPNIDFFTPTADCIKEGASVTMAGKIALGFKQTEEGNPKIGHSYPRLELDKPVCFLGNIPEEHSRYVALLADTDPDIRKLMHSVGQHVTITGKLESPDNGNQPPDAMMMFSPVIKPAG